MEYKVGDTVWFYDPEFGQCTQGTVIGYGSDQLFEVQATTYTDDGKEHKESMVVRAIGELWPTMEECITWVTCCFGEDLREQSISWYDEQQEYKKLHDAKNSTRGGKCRLRTKS